MQLKVIVIPLILVSALQLSGCAQKKVVPPIPGGTYLSTSAGGRFDQSVTLEGDEKQTDISRFNLLNAHRPLHEKSTIYIAVGVNGVVVSKNNGHTWKILKTPLASTTDIVSLKNGVLVVSGIDERGQGFVLRSVDQAKSWQSVLTVPAPVQKKKMQLFGAKKGKSSVVISIARNPFNEEQIYAGTSLGNVLVGEQSAKTWRTLYTLDSGMYSGSNAKEKMAVVDIIPSPHRNGEVLLLTVDGELYKIRGDKQAQLVVPQDLNAKRAFGSGRTILSAKYISSYPDALYIGVADGAVISRDQGKKWEELKLPVDILKEFDSSVVAVSPTNISRMFVALNDVIYRSEDGGRSWNSFGLGITGHIITDILIDPNNAANVLLVTSPLKS